MIHDLIVIGAGPTGLSVAAEARQSGLRHTLVLEAGSVATPSEAIGRYGLSVQFQAPVETVEEIRPGEILVETAAESFVTRNVVRILTPVYSDPDTTIEPSISHRVHVRSAEGHELGGTDVLVVGRGDEAVSAVVETLAAGGSPIVSFSGNISSLSRVARETITQLEHLREITVLWHSEVEEIVDSHGFPMVYWTDRRTPALQFDQVIFVVPGPHGHDEPDVDQAVIDVDPMLDEGHALGPARVWDTIGSQPERFPGARAVSRRPRTREIEQLRLDNYNATITDFDHSHDDLWVLRVTPDRADVAHRAGQYTTLGLGYWEPRVDDVEESLAPQKAESLIRRSYSISSPIIDEVGYLVDPNEQDWVEFYIVRVPPTADRVPALTPRLAAKRAGDRIFLGPKITGRYTLAPVDHPDLDVVFLATGTGEAPHNAMTNELLRKGHRGGIVSVVTVRHLRDLGYIDLHRGLEERFTNYRYLTLPTREPDIPKQYIQDVIRSGELAETLPNRLDPDRTHVFLCGNPAMIGLPTWEGDTPLFEDLDSAVALLHGLGFVPDRRKRAGNIHYEEYW